LKVENEHKQILSNLEFEIRRHRERTIALLAEKDKDIETLKLLTPEGYESNYLKDYRGHYEIPESKENTSLPKSDTVRELISYTSSPMNPATTVLHFAQEQARKDVEIAVLRKHKHSLEVSNRELHQEGCWKETQFNEQIDKLLEDVKRCERAKSRESANLEYLKNVVYQYMISYDVTSRHQMLNAISTILQFSPSEKDLVEKKLMKSWWIQSSGKTS